MSELVKTPPFRASYASVFKPQTNILSGKSEYSIVALFPKGTDFSELTAAAEAALKAKFGNDKTKWPKNLRSPFRDQKERAKDDGSLPPGYQEGAVMITLRSTSRPGVVDQNVNSLGVEYGNDAEFYSGCWARATVRAYAYDNAGNRGVSFGLGNIQKVKDDQPLGANRTKPEDDFQAIGAEASQASATDIFS